PHGQVLEALGASLGCSFGCRIPSSMILTSSAGCSTSRFESTRVRVGPTDRGQLDQRATRLRNAVSWWKDSKPPRRWLRKLVKWHENPVQAGAGREVSGLPLPHARADARGRGRGEVIERTAFP